MGRDLHYRNDAAKTYKQDHESRGLQKNTYSSRDSRREKVVRRWFCLSARQRPKTYGEHSEKLFAKKVKAKKSDGEILFSTFHPSSLTP